MTLFGLVAAIVAYEFVDGVEPDSVECIVSPWSIALSACSFDDDVSRVGG